MKKTVAMLVLFTLWGIGLRAATRFNLRCGDYER